MCTLLAEYHLSKVSGAEGPSEALQVGYYDTYTACINGEGDRDLLDWNGGPDLGYHSYLRVNYDQLRKVCPPPYLSLPQSFFDLISPALCLVPALSILPVVDLHLGALETT